MRHRVVFAREFVERVKELQPGASKRAIAKALGVDHQTINNDEDSPLASRLSSSFRLLAGEDSPRAPPDEPRLFEAPEVPAPTDERGKEFHAGTL
jgi:hypothetical protein